MSLKVGNTIPRRLYKGNNLVTRVYKGDTLQWERMTREGRSFVSPADGEVSLDTIYGKSLVWNQMVPDAKIDVPIGTYNYASYATGLAFTNGHKYIVALDNSELLVRMIITGTSYTSTAGQKILVTFTGTTGTGSSYQIQLSGTSTKVSHIKMHDLTLMFGVGNEPSTVEEFESLFPDSYYPYDAGSVLNLGALDNAIDIAVKGFNLWDEEWELGGLDSSGQNDSNPNQLRSKNYIECIGGGKYYFYSGGSNSGTACYYDSDKNFISSNTGVNRIITVPTNAAFLRFYIYKSGITTYANDICINISNPTYNGQYKPYQQEKTVCIPLTTLTSNGDFIFTDGICGIGTVRDEVGENKVIKRIGKVDLGTLDWSGQESSAGGGHIRFSAPCAGIAATNFSPNILNAYGFYGDRRPIQPTFVDKALAYYNGRIYLYDSAYTDATTFKSAMSGVMLYYELAEPIEYSLDIPFKVEYKIVEGGTESLVGLTAPIKEDIALNYK